MQESRKLLWFLIGMIIAFIIFLMSSMTNACNPPNLRQQQTQSNSQQQEQASSQQITIVSQTPPEIIYPAMANYSEGRFIGANFIPVKKITLLKKSFSYKAALKDYGKQSGRGKCVTIGHSYNGRHEAHPSENIDVLLSVPESVTVIGFLTIKSVEENVDSFIVLQKAVLSAALMNGDAILVTGEGAETVVKTSGWGIGFNNSGGRIEVDKSYATSGGTGWSTAKAKLLTFPWLQVQVLKYK